MTKIKTSYLIIILLQVFLLGFMCEYLLRYDKIHQPNVDLPEEYILINKQDTLQGYYKNDTLYIQFNNKRNKQ